MSGKSNTTAKAKKLRPNLTPSNQGLRVPQKEPRTSFRSVLPQMMELQGELIDFTIACDFLGVKAEKFGAWVARYPAVQAELKRARSAALIDLQRKVAQGGQGWQALCRIGESADDFWRRNASGRPSQPKSPYGEAMSRKRGK